MTADELRGAIDHLAKVMQPYFDARADRLGIARRPSLAWDWRTWDEVRAEHETLLALHRAQRESVGTRLSRETVQMIAVRASHRVVRYESAGLVLAG